MRQSKSYEKKILVACLIFTFFFVLKFRTLNVLTLKEKNKDSRHDNHFVDEDIVLDPTGQNSTRVFLKRLSAQNLIREEFNVTKLINFIKLYSKAMGGKNIGHIATEADTLPECLGRIIVGKVCVKVQKTIKSYLNDNSLYPMVKDGGYYKPQNCRSLHRVAILVPIRNREDNLSVFLFNIHPFLMRQELEYRIFVVEQSGEEPFNKGRLFNAGFREIEMIGDWQCIIFHDVDLLPTDYRIQYSCPRIPRHMCPSVIEMEKIKSYRTLFGGVTAMALWQYRVVNGYSNAYWAWGGEDHDMYLRLRASGLGVARYKKIARYTTLSHRESPRNPRRYDLLKTAKERFHVDGLTNHKYRKINVTLHRLYTRILVDINPTREPIPPIILEHKGMVYSPSKNIIKNTTINMKK